MSSNYKQAMVVVGEKNTVSCGFKYRRRYLTVTREPPEATGTNTRRLVK